MKKTGVLLLNLGGPETIADVKPFLINLFSDADIIPVPFPSILQKPVARLIANLRQKTSEGYYRAMGGGSPLIKITRDQAEALQQSLEGQFPGIQTYVGMRYSKPTIEQAWKQILADQIESLVVLPLYPQCSFSTTSSSYHILEMCQSQSKAKIKLLPIVEWYDHPEYINAFSQLIQNEINLLPDIYKNKYHLIFSAHSLPIKLIKMGDPYENQINKTVKLILKQLSGVQNWHLTYQSQTGWISWLEPSTLDVMQGLSKSKDHAFLIVPISFVSDHVETLYEIDQFYKAEADRMSISYFKRVPSLNINKDFIFALSSLVQAKIKAGESTA